MNPDERMEDLPVHPALLKQWEEDEKRNKRREAARNRRGPSRKFLKEKAQVQPRDTGGKFKKGSTFMSRLGMVARGEHKTIIKRSRAADRRMTRQHNNQRYNAGVPTIPQQRKKPVRRRVKKKLPPTQTIQPVFNEYRMGVLSSLLPWNWGKNR